jgi:hypothetical protein
MKALREQQRLQSGQRRLDEPAHAPETAWAGAERLINTQAVISTTGGGHPAQGPGTRLRLARALGGRSRRLPPVTSTVPENQRLAG